MNIHRLISPLLVAGALAGASATSHAAVLLSEGFDILAALPGAGWSFQNNSVPLGVTNWFQGNAADVFPAAEGAPDSYAAANFNNTTSGGRISNWMITPQIALDGNPTLEFALRLLGAEGGPIPYLDTVEVYLSTNGGSVFVGTTGTSTGDFSLLAGGSFSSDVDTGWVTHSLGLGTFAPGTTGRLAFRYFVDDSTADGNYVGIDSVAVTTVPEPTPAALVALALAGLALRRRV